MSFPIRAKLILLITTLLLVSLGLISFIAAFFVRHDLEQSAWENNISVNEMSAAAAELELSGIIAKVSVLISDIETLTNAQSAGSQQNENIIMGTAEIENFFFSENSDIVAVVAQPSAVAGGGGYTLYNRKFLNNNDIQPSMIDAFMTVQNRAAERASGGIITMLNAAPALGGIPVLSLFFNLQNSNSPVCAVFFSSESITSAFGTGTNSTILVNNSGDLLVASESSLINEGANFSNMPFVETVLKSNETNIAERYKDYSGNEFFGGASRIKALNVIVLTSIPCEVIFEGIDTTTTRNIYLSIGVWFLSILFFWFFAKKISQPLKNLTVAVKDIEDGEYHLELVSNNQDETGMLTRTVVSMSHVLENFERFTNKEIARLARSGQLETAGSKKNITMFFSDIRSFTAISEKLSPNEVIEFLNQYMERMVACVLITGGAIDKFIGDAVMAYWGAVTTAGSVQADAFNGVKTALLMRASLACFNAGRGSDKKPIIKIGCGLNSGEVVAGQIGSQERIVFTVIGDTVSFADRTETLNKPFGTEILVTEYTHNLIKDYFITERMGEVTEDNKKVGIYAVINIKEGENSEKLLADLEKLPHIDMNIARLYAGPDGPRTIEDVRKLINIPEPDLSNLNLDEEEKKYSIAPPAGRNAASTA